jgi:acyl carrier protein
MARGKGDRAKKAEGSSVQARLEEILREIIDIAAEAEIGLQDSITEDLGADSLDFVEVIMEVEDRFEIAIPDEESEKIKTVGQLLDHINRKLARKKP